MQLIVLALVAFVAGITYAQCPAGQFNNTICTNCTAITGCAGVTCTANNNSVCVLCPSGNRLANSSACVACSTCPSGQIQTAACSQNSAVDTSCGPPPCNGTLNGQLNSIGTSQTIQCYNNAGKTLVFNGAIVVVVVWTNQGGDFTVSGAAAVLRINNFTVSPAGGTVQVNPSDTLFIDTTFSNGNTLDADIRVNGQINAGLTAGQTTAYMGFVSNMGSLVMAVSQGTANAATLTIFKVAVFQGGPNSVLVYDEGVRLVVVGQFIINGGAQFALDCTGLAPGSVVILVQAGSILVLGGQPSFRCTQNVVTYGRTNAQTSNTRVTGTGIVAGSCSGTTCSSTSVAASSVATPAPSGGGCSSKGCKIGVGVGVGVGVPLLLLLILLLICCLRRRQPKQAPAPAFAPATVTQSSFSEESASYGSEGSEGSFDEGSEYASGEFSDEF